MAKKTNVTQQKTSKSVWNFLKSPYHRLMGLFTKESDSGTIVAVGTDETDVLIGFRPNSLSYTVVDESGSSSTSVSPSQDTVSLNYFQQGTKWCLQFKWNLSGAKQINWQASQ